jgi:hypothetical protein
MGIPVAGVFENMVMKHSDAVRVDVEALGLNYLGLAEFDERLETSIGKTDELAKTFFYKRVGEIVPSLI